MGWLPRALCSSCNRAPDCTARYRRAHTQHGGMYVELMRFLLYSGSVTQAIPPSPSNGTTPPAPVSLNAGSSSASSFSNVAAAQGAISSTPVAAPAPIQQAGSSAEIARIVATALASTVNLSPQAQQAVKLEAFNQLIASMVNQIQSGSTTLPSNWPTQGMAPQLQALLSQLLQQATASQALPQQLVSAQAWPTVLTQAVLQQASEHAAQAQSSMPPHTNTAANASRSSPPLPALQTWLVQHGVVQGSDGERAFTLTLRVPVAWAQAQAALRAALPSSSHAGSTPGAGAPPAPTLGPVLSSGTLTTTELVPLTFAGSVRQLASGSMGLVMQPQVLPGSPVTAAAMQAMRTSAILQLEFQPLVQALQTAQAASVYMPAHLLPTDLQTVLQNRGTDPWLLMAQAQADEASKKHPKNANEQSSFCNRAGCQYQGRAICAQPFCAEMNYLWSVDRAQRSSRI